MEWIALLFLTLAAMLVGPPLLVGVWLSARFGFYLGCASLVLVSGPPMLAIWDLIYCSNAQIVGWENENYPIYDRECGPGGLFVIIVLLATAPIVAILSVVLMKLRSRIKRQQFAPRSL